MGVFIPDCDLLRSERQIREKWESDRSVSGGFALVL